MSAARDVEALLAQIGSGRALRLAQEHETAAPSPTLQLPWPGLEAVLPDGGLPRGVVELTAPRALGGSTSVALSAVRAGLSRAPSSWCAWVDPEATLHAPGVVAAGVDLRRLLVVRPPRAELGRVAVKLVASGAFEVVVVDVDPVLGARSFEDVPSCRTPKSSARDGDPSGRSRGWAPEVLVRKLALAAEPCGATVLLLTDSLRPRAAAWPVALRLELGRPSRDELSVRVGKDRRGRVGLARSVPFHPVARVAG